MQPDRKHEKLPRSSTHNGEVDRMVAANHSRALEHNVDDNRASRKHAGTPNSAELQATGEARPRNKRAKRGQNTVLAGVPTDSSKSNLNSRIGTDGMEFGLEHRPHDLEAGGIGGPTPLRPKPRRLNSILPNHQSQLPTAPPTVNSVPSNMHSHLVAGRPSAARHSYSKVPRSRGREVDDVGKDQSVLQEERMMNPMRRMAGRSSSHHHRVRASSVHRTGASYTESALEETKQNASVYKSPRAGLHSRARSNPRLSSAVVTSSNAPRTTEPHHQNNAAPDSAHPRRDEPKDGHQNNDIASLLDVLQNTGQGNDQILKAISGLAAIADLFNGNQNSAGGGAALNLITALMGNQTPPPVVTRAQPPSKVDPLTAQPIGDLVPVELPGAVEALRPVLSRGNDGLKHSPRKLADAQSEQETSGPVVEVPQSPEIALKSPKDCKYCTSIANIFEHARIQLKGYYARELHRLSKRQEDGWASWLVPHLLVKFELTESSFNIGHNRQCSSAMDEWYRHYPMHNLLSKTLSITPIVMNGMNSVAQLFQYGDANELDTKKQNWILFFRLTRGILRYWITRLVNLMTQQQSIRRCPPLFRISVMLKKTLEQRELNCKSIRKIELESQEASSLMEGVDAFNSLSGEDRAATVDDLSFIEARIVDSCRGISFKDDYVTEGLCTAQEALGYSYSIQNKIRLQMDHCDRQLRRFCRENEEWRRRLVASNQSMEQKLATHLKASRMSHLEETRYRSDRTSIESDIQQVVLQHEARLQRHPTKRRSLIDIVDNW